MKFKVLKESLSSIKLNEAYDYERCEAYDGYDKDICNYIFNETPLYWNKEEIEEVKQKYGNVNVKSSLWHGGKISSEEELDKLSNLKPGDTMTFDHLFSTSRYKEEAKSFAFYVKSYDEMTMIRALQATYKRGSAGKFGGYLIEIETKPENIVFTTFDSDKRIPTGGAEDEAVVIGTVKVKSIKIYKPLNKDDAKASIDETIESFADLENEFIRSWASYHHISDEVDELLAKKLNEFITSEEKAKEFINTSENKNALSYGVFKYLVQTNSFVLDYALKHTKLTHEGTIVYDDGSGSKINYDLFSIIFDKKAKELAPKIKRFIDKKMQELTFPRPDHKMIFGKKFFNYDYFLLDSDNKDRQTLDGMIAHYERLNGPIRPKGDFKRFRDDIVEHFDSLTSLTSDEYYEAISERENRKYIYNPTVFIGSSPSSILEQLDHDSKMKCIDKIIRFFYNLPGHGQMDSKRTKLIEIMTKFMSYEAQRLLDLKK